MNSSTKITPIKAFSDNYIWAIHNSTTVALVDPGEATVCINFLEQQQLSLSAILITHHHPDHVGGIQALVAYCQQKKWPLTIYGPANENIPHCDSKLIENDIVSLPLLDISLQVIDLPGHTAGHIAYFSADHLTSVLFCGDTLFSGGCGRLFDGTAKQLFHSLTKLANLPENTQVYCAHEYTQANLSFALTVEPDNEDLITYSNKVNDLRANNLSTIPTSIKVEKQINPFLRSHIKAIQTSAIQFDKCTQATGIEVFTTIRRWKDQF